MALKDWELISITDDNRVWDDIKSHGRKKRVSVKKYNNDWNVYIIVSPTKEISKDFSTEKKALAFAKSYMRTH